MSTQTVGGGTQTVRATWEDRVDWALSSSMAAAAAREAEGGARRALEAGAFDELCKHVVHSVVPVLEACAAKLRSWGVSANVHQTLRDAPDRMPRAMDVSLQTDKVDGRGPGALTMTAVEGREVLRVVTCIGPGHIGGDYTRDGQVIHAYDLTDDAVGALVAALVERLLA
jgi:hypothetical protein